MKKLNLIIFLLLLAIALVACVPSSDVPSKDDSKGETPNTSENSNTEQPSNDNEKVPDTNPGQETVNEKVKFATNLTIASTFTSATNPTYLYKIGDEWMTVAHNDVTYFVKENGEYKLYIGEISGGNVEWDSDSYTFSTISKALKNADMGFLAVLDDQSSYLVEYGKKTSEKQAIVGIECTKYSEDTFEYEAWIDELTGICFKEKVEGFVYEVTSYETTCEAFPYTKPSR